MKNIRKLNKPGFKLKLSRLKPFIKNPGRFRMSPVAYGIFVFILILNLTQMLAWMRYKAQIKKEKNHIETAAMWAKYHLQAYLNQSLSITQTLNYIIEHNGIPENFDRLAEDLMKSNQSIQAIEIVQNGTITHVYPEKGNENVEGYNILEDIKRKQEAIKTIARKGLFFAGPFPLKQGGIGVVGRMPIFIRGRFFGFSAVVIKLDTLLKKAGISPSYDKDIAFQLSKTNAVSGREDYFMPGSNPVGKGENHVLALDIPVGDWKLYASKRQAADKWITYFQIILGVLFSLISGVFTWFVASRPAMLRKIINEKLALIRRNEKMMNVTQETARVGSWEVNLTEQTFRCTSTMREILEVDDDFVPEASSMIDFGIDESSKLRIQNAVMDAIQNGNNFEIESQIRTARGHIKWVRLTGKCETINHIPVFLYGATQDIHQRKQAEEERVDIIKSITDAFIAVNDEGDVTYWNHAAEAFYGIAASEILGRNLLKEIGDISSEMFIHEFKTAKSKKEMHEFEFYSDKLGSWADVSVYPKQNGFTIYMKNVTQVHRQTIALRAQNKKLKDIAWMQSHVIRSPLVRILGAVELLADKAESEPNKAKLVQLINDSAQELDVILNDITESTAAISVLELK